MSASGAPAIFDPKYTRAARVQRHAVPAQGVDRYAVRVLTITLVLAVATQKIAIPIGSGMLESTALWIWGMMAWLFYRDRLTLSPLRLGLYVATFATAFIVQSTFPAASFGSFLLACIVGFPFVAVMPSTRETQQAFLANWVRVGLCAVGLVFFDHVCQVSGIGMPNLERLLPDAFIFRTYVYIQPLYWHAAFDKPNAIFFLEASFASQFVASALVLELAIFRRLWVIVALGAGLMAIFAGTGFVLLLLCAPVYALKWLKPRSLLWILFAGAVLLAVALSTGWLDVMAMRSDDFSKAGSSGHARLVAPFLAIWSQFTEAPVSELLWGYGPGSQDKSVTIMLISSTKMLLDYGLLVMLLYMAFSCVAIFGSGAFWSASVVAFVLFHILNGAASQPITDAHAYLLTGIYAIRRPRRVVSYTGFETMNLPSAAPARSVFG